MAKSPQDRVPAAAPFAFLPPLLDRRYTEAATDRELDLRPWAAYTLGYEAAFTRFYLHLVRTVPDLGPDGFNAVPISAGMIRLTSDLLAGTVPSVGPLEMLRQASNDLEAMNNATAEEFFLTGQFRWDADTADYLGNRLPVLAGHVNINDPAVGAWLGVGRSVGEFLCDDPGLGEHDAVPFRPVVEAVRTLPRAEREGLRELVELATLIDRPEGQGEESLRKLFVARLADDWLDDGINPWPNCFEFTREIQGLHELIGEHLLTRLAGPTPTEIVNVPRWDAAAGVLMFGGLVVRRVAVQGSVVRETLRLFQAAGWPGSVETHLSGDAKQKHIASLNNGLSGIQFFAAGSKTGIGWRPIPTD